MTGRRLRNWSTDTRSDPRSPRARRSWTTSSASKTPSDDLRASAAPSCEGGSGCGRLLLAVAECEVTQVDRTLERAQCGLGVGGEWLPTWLPTTHCRRWPCQAR